MSEIWEMVEQYIHGSDHPDLQVYRRDLYGENPSNPHKFNHATWLKQRKHYCRIGDFYNARILEVGCGFGWDAVALSMIGNNHVVATDILESMIDGVKECLETMRRNGKALNIDPVVADICKTDFASESFDGIFSSQAVEHVHSLESMFDECRRLLKPGKRLVIANDSNRLNSKFRNATLQMWKERDSSWEHTEWLKREIRPVEHARARPYAAMRAEFVRRAAPGIGAAECGALTAATAGMIGPEIEAATKSYIARGVLPSPPEFSWCRNPETGEYAERLLDPFELVQMLSARGFRARVGHAFTRFPFFLANGIHFRPMNALLYEQRPLFIIVAEKVNAQ